MMFKALVAGVAAAAGVSAMSVARAEAQLAATATPITKVIELLKEMKAENEKEEKQDQEIYDKMACWCHTNREEKTAAIEAATQKIADLDARIKEGVAKSAQLTEEIKALTADIKENEASLAAATEQRQKAGAAFHKFETDNVQALGQLKGAITILSRHSEMPSTEQATDGISSGIGGGVALTKQQAGALLQTSELDTIARIVKSLNAKMGGNLISDSDLSLIQARPYANQSGEIFGILNAMQEQMSKDLSEAQAAEAKDAAEFAALREAKEEELKTQRTQLDNKEDDLANTQIQLAADKRDFEETTAQLEADQAFLADLEERCAINEKEMADRTKLRQQEIAAINETIEILMEDDARDLAKSTLTFLQAKIATTKDHLTRDLAAKALKRVASKTGSPELMMMATTVQLDAFTKVKKAIDNLVSALKQEAADEVKHKDYCEANLHKAETTDSDLNRALELLQGEKADLESKSETLKTEIAEAKSAIATAQLELQRATETRLAESKEFQQQTLDQQGMQQVLKKAINRLEAFYSSKEGAAFLQAHQGPPGLKAGGYTKMTGGANGIIGMLTEIKGDSERAEKELLTSEQDAVVTYQDFVAGTNKSVTELQKMVVSKTKQRAETDKEIVQKGEDISSTLKDLEANAQLTASLHTACDFTLKNFEVRQSTRQEEIEALQQAKSILSGAN